MPANYLGIVIKVTKSGVFVTTTSLTVYQPEPKTTKRIFHVLQTQFTYLRPRANSAQGKINSNDEFVGEYQTLMDQDFFDFVLYEVPWIVF